MTAVVHSVFRGLDWLDWILALSPSYKNYFFVTTCYSSVLFDLQTQKKSKKK